MKSKPTNVEGLLFKEQEAGYLVGYLAGPVRQGQRRQPIDRQRRRPEDPAGRPLHRRLPGRRQEGRPGHQDAQRLLAGLRRPGEVQGDRAQPDRQGLEGRLPGRRPVRPRRARRGQGEERPGHRRRRRPGLPRPAGHHERAEEGRRRRVRRDQGASRTAQFKGGTDTIFDVKSGGVGFGKLNAAGQKYADQVKQVQDKIASRRDHRHPGHRQVGTGRRPRPPSSCAGSPSASARSSRTTRVDFDLRPGEVHALLGENGAGKSTLMSVLYGLYTARRGRDPRRRRAGRASTRRWQAIDLGIGMVHQHFMLVPVMTVAENIVLANEPRNGPAARLRGGRRRACASCPTASAWPSTPTRAVEDISVGTQQRVEILRALFRGAQDPRPRRADRRAHRAGGAGPVPGAARAEGGRHVGSSSSRTSSTRCSRSPTASPCCGAARGSTRCRPRARPRSRWRG